MKEHPLLRQERARKLVTQKSRVEITREAGELPSLFTRANLDLIDSPAELWKSAFKIAYY